MTANVYDHLTVEYLLDLVQNLYDPEPCSFDHHGYCQIHFFLQEGECPDGRAQQLFADLERNSEH